jgi:exodeoxyribonuclease V alpha subunit
MSSAIAAATDPVTITGEFQRVVLEKGAWFVGRMLDNETGEVVAFSGTLAILPPIGSELAITGVWQDRGQYGMQLKAERITYSTPTTREGALRVLKTLPGIGASRAQYLVDTMGADAVIRRLLEDPDQLASVPGIGKQGAAAVAALREQRDMFEVEAQLSELGLGSRTRARAIEHFGGIDQTREVLASNPYRLVEVDRVSFHAIDDHLLKIQRFAPDSPFRATAAIVEALKDQGEKGHTWVPRSQIGPALDSLQLGNPVPTGVIETALESAVRRDMIRLVHGTDAGAEAGYAAKHLDRAESIVAEYFSRLLDASPLPTSGEVDAQTCGWLTEEQRRAVELISTGNLLVLTGGPGTGKTHTTKAILDVLGRNRTMIVAPTGKAAKRASELTGADGETIHRLAYRLLNAIEQGEATPDMWPRNIIIDEASMLSVDVAAMLLSALDPGDVSFPLVRIVLVGDVDQLPPIGPGAVLRDCLATLRVPCVRLTKIHRQAEGSAIVTNAHRIIHGEKPEEPIGPTRKDWYQVYAENGDNDRIASAVVSLHARAQTVFGIDAREIMVLSPQRAGPVGINALNDRLRAVLNPPSDDPTEPIVTMPFRPRGASKDAPKTTLRRGDRVLVTANNYNLGVVNGDLGVIADVIPGGGKRDEKGKLVDDQVVVSIDGGPEPVTFRGDDIWTLAHAYCMSTHKAQGSESRAVITVVSSSHYRMLSRRHLYTTVTRARELLVLVCDAKGLGMALKDKNEETRRSRLTGLLASRASGVGGAACGN